MPATHWRLGTGVETSGAFEQTGGVGFERAAAGGGLLGKSALDLRLQIQGECHGFSFTYGRAWPRFGPGLGWRL
jgi:hypothetical protein